MHCHNQIPQLLKAWIHQCLFSLDFHKQAQYHNWIYKDIKLSFSLKKGTLQKGMKRFKMPLSWFQYIFQHYAAAVSDLSPLTDAFRSPA